MGEKFIGKFMDKLKMYLGEDEVNGYGNVGESEIIFVYFFY